LVAVYRNSIKTALILLTDNIGPILQDLFVKYDRDTLNLISKTVDPQVVQQLEKSESLQKTDYG
jgi:hypothetical protein